MISSKSDRAEQACHKDRKKNRKNVKKGENFHNVIGESKAKKLMTQSLKHLKIP